MAWDQDALLTKYVNKYGSELVRNRCNGAAVSNAVNGGKSFRSNAEKAEWTVKEDEILLRASRLNRGVK